MSEFRQQPAAVALRGMVKLPTGDDSSGVSTGKTDFSIDLIASKEAAKLVEISGFGGYEWRGSPSDLNIPGGAFRWGAGLGFPSRNWLRVTGELNGFLNSDDTASTGQSFIGIDGSRSLLTANTDNITRASFGITAQTRRGIFFGAGVSWNVPTEARDLRFAEDGKDVVGDYYDWQFRIGYHPACASMSRRCRRRRLHHRRRQRRPEHTLTVRAEANPTSVEVGRTSTVTATAQSSIGCAVTYRWSAPSGTLAQPAERSTLWTAPQTEGSVPVTVTVTCPTDNKTASDTVNITVTRPPVRTITFEDVYFDFDRYSLRPEATRVLDEAVTALRENATLRVEIEGHTCSIGTAEYNLALGDRRANAVRDYLVSRGDHRRPAALGELRRRAAEARQLARGDAASESPRRPGGESEVVAGCWMLVASTTAGRRPSPP
jgi:outer membrane protein OmpA-like peptidoglycan-associated protein